MHLLHQMPRRVGRLGQPNRPNRRTRATPPTRPARALASASDAPSCSSLSRSLSALLSFSALGPSARLARNKSLTQKRHGLERRKPSQSAILTADQAGQAQSLIALPLARKVKTTGGPAAAGPAGGRSGGRPVSLSRGCPWRGSL